MNPRFAKDLRQNNSPQALAYMAETEKLSKQIVAMSIPASGPGVVTGAIAGALCYVLYNLERHTGAINVATETSNELIEEFIIKSIRETMAEYRRMAAAGELDEEEEESTAP